MPPLPELTAHAKRHPGCCLSLSRDIIKFILEQLPKKPSLTLSIGSGTGLLEALIMQQSLDIDIEGVEVNSAVNKWLPNTKLHVVNGTWDLCPEAQHAETWLFAYPRSPDLLKKYVQEYGSSPYLKSIIWIGPAVDWDDFQACFDGASWQLTDPIFPTPFELLVIVDKICQKDA